jgi:hypothetical protein
MRLDIAYVAQAETPEGFVKVGRSASPESRLVQLARAVPFQMRTICFLADGTRTERALKESLCTARVKGEWFEPSLDLVALLNDAAAQGQVVERRPIDADYFREVIGPKLDKYMDGKTRCTSTPEGDHLYRVLHGEPLCFVGREGILGRGCPDVLSPAELFGFQPVRLFKPFSLNGRRIEQAPVLREVA